MAHVKQLPRVLSIQSHVVHGYAGNRSVVFPLQLNDFEVDNINTVQKCTHNRYPAFTGTLLSIDSFRSIIDGLRKNNLLYRYDYVMTGYISSKELLLEVANTVKEMKENSSQPVTYLCDPVMGDIWPEIAHDHSRGKMYIPADILPFYQNHVVGLADILTPNQCELELLIGEGAISSETKMIATLKKHFPGKIVCVTSNLDLGTDHIVGYAKDKTGECYRFKMPRTDITLVGTGDCFSANLVAQLQHNASGNLEKVLQSVLWTMHIIVTTTRDCYLATIGDTASGADEVSARELQLIRCQKEIRYDTKNPQKKFDIVRL